MAIDMIENNGLQHMAPAVHIYEKYAQEPDYVAEKTDGHFANFSLIGSIFPGQHRIEKKQQTAASATAAMAQVNKAYPVPADCKGLLETQDKLNNEIYQINQKITAGSSIKSMQPWMDAFSARLLVVKNKIKTMNCVIAAEQEQLQKDQQFTLESLSKATADAPSSTASDKVNSYLIYGIAGVMIIAAIVILIKKKSNPS